MIVTSLASAVSPLGSGLFQFSPNLVRSTLASSCIPRRSPPNGSGAGSLMCPVISTGSVWPFSVSSPAIVRSSPARLISFASKLSCGKRSASKKYGLWNERDFGYLATYVANLVLDGKLTGKLGQTFTAGRLGKRTVVKSDGNSPVVVLGDPLVFTPQNIDKFNF